MITIIELIIDELYTPLLLALNEISLLSQELNNSMLIFSLSELIATIITVTLFGFILYMPIKLVYIVIKRILP